MARDTALRPRASGSTFPKKSGRFARAMARRQPHSRRHPCQRSPGRGEGAAIRVERPGRPRISSVEFSDFCIDGLHFTADGPGNNPENSYVNGKTGIFVADANDSFRITGMGFVYLEHALTIYNADALSIHDNFIAECGSCIELRGWGQASKVTDNFVGAGFRGHSIYAENHGGTPITANNSSPEALAVSTLTVSRVPA